MSKSDVRTLKRGLKRVTVALLTAMMFALAVVGFIAVAIAPGYLAVLLFLASLVALGFSAVLLYAQGIARPTYTESKGERNE